MLRNVEVPVWGGVFVPFIVPNNVMNNGCNVYYDAPPAAYALV